MQDQYLSNWQIRLNRNKALILFTVIITLVACYGYILYSRFQAQEYLNNALFYLQETQTLSSQDLVKKSLLYQNAMRSLQASIDLNPLDARSYFEYGQIISDLAEDDNLISSLDVDRMDIKGGRQGFYNLAKVYYRNAILHEPTNAIYHQRLGSLLDKMGVTEEAEREFGKAVILDKQNVSIHIYLAQYFLSKGRVAQFNTHLNKVKELDISGGGWLGDLVSGFLKKIETEDLVK